MVSRPTTSDATDVDLVAAAFLTCYGAMLHDPSAVRERCQPLSEEFAARCAAAGLEAEVISGVEFGEVPEFPGARLMLAGHFAVRVRLPQGAAVYDWTARQFDAGAPVPLILDETTWRQRWTDIGTIERVDSADAAPGHA